MSAVIVDTHTLVWYLSGSNKLSQTAQIVLDQTNLTGHFIYVSSISLIEVAYLIERGRLPELAWQQLYQALTDPNIGITEAAIDRAIAQTLRQIPRNIIPEMPDRIIAATALHLNLPLVTRDHKIQALITIQTIW